MRADRLGVASALLILLCSCSDGAADEPAAGGGGEAGGQLTPPEVGPPATACQPGELELDDGSCQAAGIPAQACGDFLLPTGDGSCEPILPASPCTGAGTMAVPGEGACRPVAACDKAPWGDAPIEATTQFVDGGFGGQSDGTAAAPWTSIQQAIDAAADGAAIAVAAGNYAEALSVAGKAVRIWGRCPELVTIASPDASPSVSLQATASGSELHALGISGRGVVVTAATGLLLDRLWIHAVDGIGVHLEAAAQGTVTGSLIELCGEAALRVEGASANVEACSLRDTHQAGTDVSYAAIQVDSDATVAMLAASRLLIERAGHAGVRTLGADSTIVDSVVRDISDPIGAYGIVLRDLAGRPSSSEVRRVVVTDMNVGLIGANSELVVEHVAIRDLSEAVSDGSGLAIGMLTTAPELERSVTVRASTIRRVANVGLFAEGAQVTAEGLLVEDVTPFVEGTGYAIKLDADDGMGGGSIGSLRGVHIERATTSGIRIEGSEADIDSTLVSDTRALVLGYAVGIETVPDVTAELPSVLQLRASLIRGTAGIGVLILGCSFDVHGTRIQDTIAGSDDLLGAGLYAQMSVELGWPADGSVAWSSVERSRTFGVVVNDATVTFEHLEVAEVTPSAKTGLYGDGVAVVGVDLVTFATLSDSLISGCQRAGVASFAASAELERNWLDCNTMGLAIAERDGVLGTLVDKGGNRCGCGAGDDGACKVLSAEIVPPEPL